MRDLNDTRRSPRISCDLPMEYQIPGTHPRNGRITKLGTLGALLTTHETVPLGAELLLSFHLPLSKRQINTVGTVRWTSQGRAGVEFAHLGLQQRDEIWRYYARQSAQQRLARS
ncbi:MAG: PilZ domain-containing protein [candidate division NC10 bacterium]